MTVVAEAAAEPPVLVERRGHVLVVTFNRPASRNVVDLHMARTIAGAMEMLDADPELRVAVLAGNGPVFCAGMDLKAFARGESPRIPPRGFAGVSDMPPATPLIAAVDGPALGGGFEVALACDLIIASSLAVFGLPEVTRGLTPNGGALLRLPRRIPYHVAMELLLTGTPITAGRAYELGLVNQLVEGGTALERALDLAELIAGNGPLATMAAKRVVVESDDWPLAVRFARQETIVGPVRASADASEGATAFAEKRRPHWTGS